MKNKIVKRTYTILHGKPSDRVEYISHPLDFVGQEVADINIHNAHIFSSDDIILTQMYKSGICNGNDRYGDFSYMQEIVIIPIEMKIGKWDAMVHFDEAEKQYTISYVGEGGAIVSDVDISVAENKFIEAMGLAVSVGKLLHFKENNSFPPKEITTPKEAYSFPNDFDVILSEAERQGWVFHNGEWKCDGYRSRSSSSLYEYLKNKT
jgi:hypothetical protein